MSLIFCAAYCCLHLCWSMLILSPALSGQSTLLLVVRDGHQPLFNLSMRPAISLVALKENTVIQHCRNFGHGSGLGVRSLHDLSHGTLPALRPRVVPPCSSADAGGNNGELGHLAVGVFVAGVSNKLLRLRMPNGGSTCCLSRQCLLQGLHHVAPHGGESAIPSC